MLKTDTPELLHDAPRDEDVEPAPRSRAVEAMRRDAEALDAPAGDEPASDLWGRSWL
ncbi:MAG: hypothetical protein MI723_04565 [Caulobacterales bacterium]|nr:hypothetical protein [Caulobacterales bacterium]